MIRNKKGFTLVELLAVIVILAIILVIAVPQIMTTIEESRKAAFISNAKLIAKSAENRDLENTTLGLNETISCADVVKLSLKDYASCKVTFNANGDAEVTIVGLGKFEGMSILKGTKKEAEIQELGTIEYGIGVDYINALYNNETYKEAYGLEKDDTSDENIRYTGLQVNNYVKFNDELWRIVGIFNVSDGTTTEDRIKLVRDNSIGSFSWDSSANGVNNGAGVNEWSEADLNALLNNTYYNKTTSTTCYNGWNNKYANCDFTSTGLGSAAKSMITSTVWNTGGVTWGQGGVAKNSYTAERGTVTGKECTSDTMSNGAYYCTDEVTRTTSDTEIIGLIYPSDYLYASKDTNCRTKGTNESYYCKNDNWLHTGYHYWLLSPLATSTSSTYSWFANRNAHLSNGVVINAYGVRPSVYLKSNVQITGGVGSKLNPYTLSV